MNAQKMFVKCEEIKAKAIKIARKRGNYSELIARTEIAEDGVEVNFDDPIKDEWIATQLVIWKDLEKKQINKNIKKAIELLEDSINVNGLAGYTERRIVSAIECLKEEL